jgi:hypothetical protein
MIWLISFLIIHILCSIISKKAINWAFDDLQNRGGKLFYTNNENLDERINNFVKKFIIHIPILNIYLAYVSIKFYIRNLYNNKK